MTIRSRLIPLGMLLSAGLTLAWPNLGSAAATCTIVPQDPAVATGPFTWKATYTGFSTPSYRWTFTGATSTQSTATQPTVTYNKVGGFATTLKLSGGGTSATCKTTVTVAPKVSINSTSQSSTETASDPYTVGKAVTEAPRPKNANSLSPASGTGSTSYQLLAINDLGMHCGDLDTRISSILPPFQVLLSQVIKKGAEPEILGPGQVKVFYSAASNPSDPILSEPFDPKTGYPFTGLVTYPTGAPDVYKTNFWDIAYKAYDPFYPKGVLANFYDPNNPTANRDKGLPVPNVENLYIGTDGLVLSGDEELTAVQHAMPGIAGPYVKNNAQWAEEHYGDKPFFVNFPFGYVANDVNWFEGAGVPFAAFDDFGRQNPYPLVRVQAKNTAGTVLATTDTVLPISGEANCQGCHAAGVDGGNGSGIKNLGSNVTVSTQDPAYGKVPDAVSVEWASDLNILALHDKTHKTTLRSDYDATGRAKDPVVCQRCHYTPALDLAQVGPNNVNGREQETHKSMSSVMHKHHADVTAADGKTKLFPDMPAPDADTASTPLPANQATREAVLEQTCYSCHPGKNTKCMRGAMADGGMVCQDCHGQMAQVGEDFSHKLPAGGFELASDFYTNPETLRVPWANEPGCGSCHTGDATSNLAGSIGTLTNGYDTNGVADGIRLIQAYYTDDSGKPTDGDGNPTVNAKPIVPTNKRFAENTVPERFPENDPTGFTNPGAGNPKLYRVSTGHGGVMCEGCHGATHAEWDTSGSPVKNDNVTANQLQGHSGTVSECSTCHTTSSMDSKTQGGPHGMHLVNDYRFWKEGHKDLAKAENRKPDGGSCGACHGADHLGSVLSRAPVARSFNVESRNRTVAAGEPVACNLCHSLDKSFEGSGGDD